MLASFLRLPSRYALPLFLLLDLAFLFNRGADWKGQWLWTADSVAGCLIILGPFAAALASWHVQFQRELASGVFRFDRSVVGVFRAQYGWLAGLHAAVLLFALSLTYSADSRLDVAVLHALPQFAILAGFIALGILVGSLIPSWFTGPLLAIGLFLVAAFHATFVPRALVKFGGASGDPSGMQANWDFDAHHTLFGAGVVLLLGFLGLRGWRRLWSRAVPLSCATVGLVLVATGWTFFANTHVERFVERTEPVVCSRQEYTLCLIQDSASDAGPMSEDMRNVFDSERALGATAVPTGLVQVTPGQSSPKELTASMHPVTAEPDSFSASSARRLQVVLPYLLLDTRCADRSQPTAEQFQSMEVLEDYYLISVGHDQSAGSDPGYARLSRLSTSAQHNWLRVTLSALNTCQINHIALPDA